MGLTPIETTYKGHRFRSRLEARWAVYFDALGILWSYEPEGFDLQGFYYLPDFWLPQVNMWAEVKPGEFTVEEFLKAALLAKHSGKTVIQLVGPPDLKLYTGIAWEPWPPDEPNLSPDFPILGSAGEPSLEFSYVLSPEWLNESRFWHEQAGCEDFDSIEDVADVYWGPKVRRAVEAAKTTRFW